MPRLDPAAQADIARGRAVAEPADAPFGAPFWFTYGANFSLTVANSLLFRYADFVKAHDGDDFEFKLGWIVGVGMVGSLAMRVAQGVGIDRYGPRLVWLISSLLFAASCFGHIAVESVDGPAVYVLRIALQTGLAGFFGASITFVSGRASVARMADVVGTLGTSGFIGMMAGSSLGDWLFTHENLLPSAWAAEDWMFALAGSLGLAALAFSWLATAGTTHSQAREPASLLELVRERHPGAALLAVGAAVGFGLGLPGTFVRPFAESRHVANIGAFFGVYAPLAFATRLAIRRFPARFGVRPMIHVGLAFLACSMAAMLVVQASWHFALPAVLIGVAHAFLFPAVVAGGTASFPIGYRGLGTTLILAMFDLGSVLGSPLAGSVIKGARSIGWPPFPTMFLSVAALVAVVALVYALSPKIAPAYENE